MFIIIFILARVTNAVRKQVAHTGGIKLPKWKNIHPCSFQYIGMHYAANTQQNCLQIVKSEILKFSPQLVFRTAKLNFWLLFYF